MQISHFKELCPTDMKPQGIWRSISDIEMTQFFETGNNNSEIEYMDKNK